MNKKTPQMPRFKTGSEEADWWASKAGRAYVKQKSAEAQSKGTNTGGSKLVAMLNKKSSVQIAIRLPEADLAEARKIAGRKGVGHQTLHPGLERDLALADRGINPDVGESRPSRLTDQPDVTAQAAAFDAAFPLSGGVGVIVRFHHRFERHRHHQQAEDVRSARTDRCGEIHLAGGEAELAHLTAVNIDCRV